jgi:hypothetical protein
MHRSPKRMRAELNQWKCMMIVALWRKQVLTYEILPKGQIVDKVVYLNFLERRVLPEVHRKKFGRPIILHDNARPHKHRLFREFLQKHRWEELDHPPSSPIVLTCHRRIWTESLVLKGQIRGSNFRLKMSS